MKRIVYFITVFFISIALPVDCFSVVDLGFLQNTGHVKLFFFPPYNEFDPNPGILFADRITARYGLDIHTEFYATDYRKLYFFMDSFSLFGDTKPQIDYNYSADPIVMILTYGVGFRVSHHVDVGVQTGKHINLGKYVLGERLRWAGIYAKFSW